MVKTVCPGFHRKGSQRRLQEAATALMSDKWKLKATPTSPGGIAFLPAWLTHVTCFSRWDLSRGDVNEGFKNACAVEFLRLLPGDCWER